MFFGTDVNSKLSRERGKQGSAAIRIDLSWKTVQNDVWSLISRPKSAATGHQGDNGISPLMAGFFWAHRFVCVAGAGHLRACLFDELKLGGIANLRESVADDVTQMNKSAFEDCRAAIAQHQRILEENNHL